MPITPRGAGLKRGGDSDSGMRDPRGPGCSFPRRSRLRGQDDKAQGGGALLLWHFRLRLDPSVFEIMYASKRPRKSGLKRRESSQAFPIFHDKISSTGWFFTKQTERMTKI